MKNKGFRIFCLVIGIFMTLPLYPCSVYSADVGDAVRLNLKNKGKITGTVKEESAAVMVLEMGFGTMAISKGDIESIEVLEESMIRDKLHRSSRGNKRDHEKKWRERIEQNKQIRDEMIEKRRKMIEHKIKFDDPHSIVVEAVIDAGVATELVVDTGAALVMITPETAERAGYTVSGKARKVELRLADGSMMEGIAVTLGSVEVAGAVAENVKAVIAERGGDTGGLLGMSFLNRFNVHIDSNKKEMVLKEL